MPEGLFPWEFEPVENRRKRFVQQGGLGNDMNGWKNPNERQQHICVHCRKRYEYTAVDLEFNDLGETGSNLCADCQKIKRAMTTNHPEMK